MLLSLRPAAALLAALALASCGGDDGGSPSDVPGSTATLLAAGDIGQCASKGDEQTARLAEQMPGATVAALGDLAYPDGSEEDFKRCWDPSWGRLGDRVRPTPGNHEYGTGSAEAYFNRFPRAGRRDKGWYSYELGAWHIVVLNSHCAALGDSCEPGGEQERWLRADLKAHPAKCTLAYWHHARYSSGNHGDDPLVEPLWRALTDARADVVLQGHDHHYERFAPRDGLRGFVVGTGGTGNYDVGPGEKGSEVRWADGHGLLALTLRPDSYEWRFLAAGGARFRDSGRTACT